MQDKPRLHHLGKMIAACEVYIVHDDSVLMHKRADDKKKFPGFWIGPGGHIDAGEDALSAALREVYEETGIAVAEKDIKLKVLAFHHHLDRGEVWIEYLFRATVLNKQSIRDTHEGYSEWIKIDDLIKLDNVFPPSKHYFDHILKDKHGILYNASEWQDSQLVKVLSERVDADF